MMGLSRYAKIVKIYEGFAGLSRYDRFVKIGRVCQNIKSMSCYKRSVKMKGLSSVKL